MDQSMMAWMSMQNQQQNTIQNHPQNQQNSQPWTSQFHFFKLIENLADAVEGGVRDQHSDMLVSELTMQLEKCQQSLNSVAGSNDATTVSGQKQKLEEYEKQLNHRRDLITKYLGMVDNYIGSS
ncbi:mediator of RNA polymerase II transcription subunit 9 [Cryptomeria japonica]|uniref:mediator of RNA polymerase II transcription subunit 9 n=1 Tax=Cryptomeria japonica TaxID=3369 RepID=UPI0025ABDA1F|nr:mediator of RNA polymerase II transcription subunit 9 [Cryptomeria japonica]